MSGNNSHKKIKLLILLIAGLVVAAAGAAAVILDAWIGLAIILGGMLMGLSGGIGLRNVNARYNPRVEDGSYKMGETVNCHPEDVPLNPWDTISCEGEK